MSIMAMRVLAFAGATARVLRATSAAALRGMMALSTLMLALSAGSAFAIALAVWFTLGATRPLRRTALLASM